MHPSSPSDRGAFRERSAGSQAAIPSLGRSKRDTLSERISITARPMLATLTPEPFHRPGWVYEEKYDGYRVLACKEGKALRLLSRNGKDRTATFAQVAAE